MRRINLQKNRKRKKLEDTISKILQDPREDKKNTIWSIKSAVGKSNSLYL